MTSSKILVIDDEIQIRRLIKVGVESHGHQFLEAASGEEGIKLVASAKPDILILDLGLPGISGFDTLKRIREWSQVPIIILSVQDDEGGKVEALDSGANDYLTKPFGMAELFARIRVLLRKQSTPEEDSVFTVAHLEVNLGARVVKVQDKEIHLTATEYSLLNLFIRHAGKVLTHNQIIKEIWGNQPEGDIQSLRIYISALRKKIELDQANPTLLLTEPGVGYRLRDQ
ncbi:MAG: response regulator transcription factor [Deltaproteobacteria bacterium]|nr:response regulator transcription factor [Deltaproteobacteria bacterium]